MIRLRRATKIYGRFKSKKLVLSDQSFTFVRGSRYVILGAQGSGKSSLLRLLCGLQKVTIGSVVREGQVAVPPGGATLIAPNKTPRQLTRFMAQLYAADPDELTDFVTEFAGLGAEMGQPLSKVSLEKKLRFNFALSYGLPAAYYLFDDRIAAGSAEFQARCTSAFLRRQKTAGTVVATRDVRGAPSWGERGIVLKAGQLHEFATVPEAIEFFEEAEHQRNAAGLAFAQSLMRAGQLARAADYLGNFLAQNAGAAPAHELLAELMLKLDRSEGAAKQAQIALQHQPDLVGAWLVSAKVAELEGRNDDAITAWLEAVRLAPENLQARSSLARRYELMARYTEAGQAWAAIARQTQGQSALQLAISNFARAEDWAEVAALLESPPGRVDPAGRLVELKVRALIELGRIDNAADAVNSLAVIDADRAIGAIYMITSGGGRRMVAELVNRANGIVWAGRRSLRTTTLLLAFLERQLAAGRLAGDAEETQRVTLAISAISPERFAR